MRKFGRLRSEFFMLSRPGAIDFLRSASAVNIRISIHRRDTEFAEIGVFLDQELFTSRPLRLCAKILLSAQRSRYVLNRFDQSKSRGCRILLQAAQKDSEARRAKFDERRRTLLYVDAKSVERNEAYETFSAAC